jgi:hypothetical protein
MPPVTSKVPGNGTNTLSWTVPGDGMDVETVYASVDATGAGGAVTAEITIADQSGVVIARKTQGSTIAAGGTGSATWALRLDDDSTAGGGGGGITLITSTDGSITVTTPAGPTTDLSTNPPPTAVEYMTCGSALLGSGASANVAWFHSSGSALVDYTNANAPKVIAAGTYAWSGSMTTLENLTAGGDVRAVLAVLTGPTPASYSMATGPTIGQFPFLPLNMTVHVAANTTFTGGVFNFDTIGHQFQDAQTFALQKIH